MAIIIGDKLQLQLYITQEIRISFLYLEIQTLSPDMIPARILRECSDELAPILTIVFNRTLQTGCVPEDWKQANVSAVFKKGQRYDPANYRPVSLTCLCCKMLEHIITSSIMKHVDHHHILSDCQHGFEVVKLSW